MPGFNGTGPNGMGPMTGRGMGYCNNNNTGAGRGMGRSVGFGRGMGRGMGFGRGMGRSMGFGGGFFPGNFMSAKEEEAMLKERLKAVQEEIASDNE